MKMQKSRRSLKRNESADDLTRSSKKNKRTYLTRSSAKNKIIRNERKTTELLISGDLHLESNQGVLSELSEQVVSKFSKSVVSLSLSNGIAVERKRNVTRFLTSASLVKALFNARKYHDNLKVKVCHEDNIVIGFLGEYNVDCNFAVVNTKNFLDLETVGFSNLLEFPPDGNVVSVGREISGKLTTTSGILNCDLSRSVPSLVRTTCKISKVCEGGAVFDYDGNFLGMNSFFSTEGTLFMPKYRLLETLFGFCTPVEEIRFPKKVRVEESSNGEMPNSHQEVHQDVVLNEDRFRDLESLGYPEPPKSLLNDGTIFANEDGTILSNEDAIILANNFEEPFGDICGRGVWSELSETVASSIQDNIVALASFNGEKRFFACTGFLIEWNRCTTILTAASLIRDSYLEDRIIQNLRIEVLLPNKRLAEGILQHYSLRYNIALVSVNGFCAAQPVKIQCRFRDHHELLAVGCVFKSRKLMAARGVPFPTPVTHDCKFLRYTTCGITKAGIGGPLLEFDGTFVGINLYDKYGEGTPYLRGGVILKVLKHFKRQRTVAEAGHDGYASLMLGWTIPKDKHRSLNSWPVPLPFWTTLDDLEMYDFAMRMRREQFFQPELVWVDKHAEV